MKRIARKHITLGLLFLGMLLANLSINGMAQAGIVVKCEAPKSKVGKVCIIKTRFAKKGNLVVIKNGSEQRYWKATGTIVRDKGEYGIVVFKDTNQYIGDGDTAEVTDPTSAGTTEWKSSFSNGEFF